MSDHRSDPEQKRHQESDEPAPEGPEEEPSQHRTTVPDAQTPHLPTENLVVPSPAVGPHASRPRFLPAMTAAAIVGLIGGLLGGGIGANIIAQATSGEPATVTSAMGWGQNDIEHAVETISHSVVTVNTHATTGDGSTGSGIVMATDGDVLTNFHVVADGIKNGKITVTLSGGATFPATVVGTDQYTDLAVLDIDTPQRLTPAKFADSSDLNVGQRVLAVGAPLGLSNTVTAGIISSVHRPVVTSSHGATTVIDAIQTDAAINPGNSGGPLVNLAGEVIGVNSAIATSGRFDTGNIGLGFAIPANMAESIYQQIRDTGSAQHPIMGVNVVPDIGGPRVVAVVDDTPASRVGLEPGDIITNLAGRTIRSPADLVLAVRTHHVGDVVSVSFLRDGDSRTTTLTLTSTSDD